MDDVQNSEMVQISKEEHERLKQKGEMFDAMNEADNMDDAEEIQAEHELQSARHQLLQQEAEIKELKKKLGSLHDSDRAKLAQFEEADDRRSQLLIRVNTLEKEAQNLKIEKQSLLDRNHFLQSANDKLMKETMKYSEQYLKLCEQIGDYQKQNTELKVQNEHLSATKQNWEDQLNAKNKMIEWYKRQLHSGEQALVKEVENRANKVEELMATIRSQARKLEEANVEFEKARVGLESQKKQTHFYSEKCQELTLELEVQRNDFTTKHQTQQSQIDVAHKGFEDHKSEMNRKLEKEAQYTAKLESKLKDARGERKSLEDEVNKLQQDKSSLQDAVKDLEEELDTATRNSVDHLLATVDENGQAEDMDLKTTQLFQEYNSQKQYILQLQQELNVHFTSLQEVRDLHQQAETNCEMHKQKEDMLRRKNQKLNEEIEDLREFDRKLRSNTVNVKAHYDHTRQQNEKLRAEIANYLFTDGSGGRSKKEIQDILADNERKQEEANVWKTRFEQQGLEFEKQIDQAMLDIENIKTKEAKWKREYENIQTKFDKLLTHRQSLSIKNKPKEDGVVPALTASAASGPMMPVLYADVQLERQFVEYRKKSEHDRQAKDAQMEDLNKRLRDERLKHFDIQGQLKIKTKELEEKQIELQQVEAASKKIQNNLEKARRLEESERLKGIDYQKTIAELEVDIARLKRQLEIAQTGGNDRDSTAISDGSNAINQEQLERHLELFKKVVKDDQKIAMQQKETQYIQAMKQVQILETDLNHARERSARELESVNLELANSQAKLKEEERKTEKQKEMLDSLNRDFKSQAEQLKDLVRAIDNSSRIGVDIRDYELENHAFKKQNEKLKESFAKLQTTYEKDLKSLREKLDLTTKDLDGEKSLHKVCRDSLKTAQGKLESKTQEIAKLKEESSKLKKNGETMRARNAELEKAKPALERMIKTVRSQLQQENQARKRAETERDEAKKKSEAAAPELAKMRKEKDDAMREATRLKNEKAKRRDIAMEYNKLKQEKNKLEKRVKELESQSQTRKPIPAKSKPPLEDLFPPSGSNGTESAERLDFRVKQLQLEKQELLKIGANDKTTIMRLENQLKQRIQRIKELEERIQVLQKQPKITGGLQQYDAQRRKLETDQQIEEVRNASKMKDESNQQIISQLKKAKQELQINCNQLKKEKIALERERDGNAAKMKAMEEGLTKYRTQFMNEKNNTANKIKQKDVEIAKITKEKALAERRGTEAEKRNSLLMKSSTALKRESQILKQKLNENRLNDAQTKEIRRLKTDNQIQQNKIQALRKERAESCAKFDENMKKLISDFQAHVKEVEAYQKEAKSPLEGIDAKERLKQQLNRMAGIMTQLKNVVKKQKEQLLKHVRTEAENQDLLRKVKELQESINESKTELTTLKEDLEKEKKKTEAMRNHASKLKETLDEKTKEAGALLLDKQNLEADINVMETDLENLQQSSVTQANGLQSVQDQQKVEIEQHVDRITQLEGALKEAEASIQAGEKRLADVEHNKDTELALLRIELSNAQAKVDILQKDVDAIRKEYEAKLEETSKDQHDMIECLKQNNQQLTERGDELSAQVEARDEEIARLKGAREDQAGEPSPPKSPKVQAPSSLAPIPASSNAEEMQPPLTQPSERSGLTATLPASSPVATPTAVKDDFQPPSPRKRSHPDDAEDEQSRKRRRLNEEIADDGSPLKTLNEEVVQEPTLTESEYQEPDSMDEDPPVTPQANQDACTHRGVSTDGFSNCATMAEEDARHRAHDRTGGSEDILDNISSLPQQLPVPVATETEAVKPDKSRSKQKKGLSVSFDDDFLEDHEADENMTNTEEEEHPEESSEEDEIEIVPIKDEEYPNLGHQRHGEEEEKVENEDDEDHASEVVDEEIIVDEDENMEETQETEGEAQETEGHETEGEDHDETQEETQEDEEEHDETQDEEDDHDDSLTETLVKYLSDEEHDN